MDNFIKISALLCALIYQMTTVSAQTVSKDFFGKTSDGIDTNVITLENSSGMKIKMTDYGATMLSVIVPDRNGVFKDVVLGFNTLKEYGYTERDVYRMFFGTELDSTENLNRPFSKLKRDILTQLGVLENGHFKA